jgi:hypothetical protein
VRPKVDMTGSTAVVAGSLMVENCHMLFQLANCLINSH